MPFSMTLSEIAKLVCKAEKAGEKYYRQLARRVPDEGVRQICLFFADQERDHFKIFDELAREVSKDRTEKSFSIDVVSLIEEGIKKFAETGFQLVTHDYRTMTVGQCLEVALNAELQTIEIYQEVQKALSSKYDVVLYNIIREETEHADTIRRAMAQSKNQPVRASKKKALSKESPVRDRPVRRLQENIIFRKIVYHTSGNEFFNVAVLIVLFIGLIVALVGPNLIMEAVRALVHLEPVQ